VVTIFREGYLATPVYAEPLRQLGAYGSKAALKEDFPRSGATAQRENSNVAPLRRRVRNLPPALKNPLVRIWNFGFSIWREVKHVAEHLPSMITIPSEFFRFKPDVVHTHGFYGFKYGLLFKTLFRRPLVHIVPCLLSQMEAQRTGWLWNRYRRFHRHVDCFALDSGYRNELLSIDVPAHKLLDIDGTLDLDAIGTSKAESKRHRREVRRKLSIPEDAIIESLANATPVDMRLKLSKVNGVTVLNDAYNANPASMAAALHTLAEQARRAGAGGAHHAPIAVLGDMLELGDHGPAAHAEIGTLARELGVGVVALGELGRGIATTAGGEHVESPAAAAAQALARTSAGDWILLKASRGMRLERVLDAIRLAL